MYKLSVQILVYNFFLCEQMLEIWEFVLILVGAEAFVGIVAGIFFWRKHVDKKYNIIIIQIVRNLFFLYKYLGISVFCNI